MKESLATFRKAVNESADLQEKLKGGTNLVELGKENGYDFSQEDVTAAFEELNYKLKDSEVPIQLTCFESQLRTESGGSESGSSGGSSFWWWLMWAVVWAAVAVVVGVLLLLLWVRANGGFWGLC